MRPCRINSSDAVRRGVPLVAMILSAALTGCSPEGTGSIKVEDPQAVRSRFEGDAARGKPSNEKQAKALQLEAEAAKKNPKLR